VLDGHGGDSVAEYASKKLHIYFDEKIKEEKNNDTDIDRKIVNALNHAFTRVESEFYKIAKSSFDSGSLDYLYVGACALAIVVHNNKLYVANCGDSKAKLFRQNFHYPTFMPIKLSRTLNAGSKKEQNRLRAEYTDEDIFVCKRAGGKACYVKGRLQPTRSLGDFYLKHSEFNSDTETVSLRRKLKNFKGPYIKYLPEIKIVELSKDDKYIVLATDGLWDELNGRDVAEVIQGNNGDKNKIVESLFNSAILHAANEAKMSLEELMNISPGRGRRSLHDDITVIVVDLMNQFN